MIMNGTSPATPPATRTGPKPAPTARILLVDDDLVFGEAIASVLRAAGFEVFLAPDYRLALEDIESTRPIDLLITDVVMPERVNGVALSRMARIRRSGLKIIYLTAYDIPGVEDEAIGPVLRKPIDDARLVSEVRRVLGMADAGSTGKLSDRPVSTGSG
jgi:CheY-like chemotaxis protein